jgi:hypothetical protein
MLHSLYLACVYLDMRTYVLNMRIFRYEDLCSKHAYI